MLPRSITQAAEEESLKGRFGVERLPEVGEVNSLVRVTESQGIHGPDRTRRRAAIVVFLLLIIGLAVAAVVLHEKGMLPIGPAR